MTNKPRLNSTGNWSALLIPLLLGTFLRFARLGDQPLFLDEAFTADLVLRPWGEMLDVIMADVHPPLFYVLLKPIVTVLPLTEWTLRSLSAFCSVVALALAMGLARRLGGQRTAAMTGWVLSWSALHLYYAQDARMYALLDIWWVLAVLMSFYASQKNRWMWFTWSAVILAAIYTHFYGFALWVAGAFGGWMFILCHRKWQDLRWWAASQAVILAGAAPLLSFLIRVAQKGVGGTWVPTWRDPLDLLALMLFGFSPVRDHFLNGYLLVTVPWDYSRAAGEWMVLVPLGFALAGWNRRSGNRNKWFRWLLGVYAFLPLCAVTFLLWAGRIKFWAYRPFIGVATLAAVGLAAGWSSLLGQRWQRGLLIGALFLLNLGSLWSYEFRWVKDYGRTAFQTLPAPALVLDRHYISYVFYFYRPDWKGELFGLVPRSDGPYEVARVTKMGPLQGQIRIVDCEELPAQVALYDPAGRRFGEGDQWPSCLRERAGWLFNPETERWEATSSLIP